MCSLLPKVSFVTSALFWQMPPSMIFLVSKSRHEKKKKFILNLNLWKNGKSNQHGCLNKKNYMAISYRLLYELLFSLYFFIYFFHFKQNGAFWVSQILVQIMVCMKKNDVFFAIPLNFFKWKKNGQKIFLSACHLYQKIAHCLN